jgi:hypothetical protein
LKIILKCKGEYDIKVPGVDLYRSGFNCRGRTNTANKRTIAKNQSNAN